MTRRDWTEVAEAIASVRRRLRTRGARVLLVDRVAESVCRTLRDRSTRFDARRFMRIVRG